MKRKEIAKLLGGYAADNLTPEEREALFTAALEDQQLFDALAREQGLRDLLQDPGARRELIAAMEAPPRPVWWRRTPVVALAGAMAMVVASVLVFMPHLNPPAPHPTEVAQLRKEPAPAPQPLSPAPPAIAEPRRTMRPVRPLPSVRPQLPELPPVPESGVGGGVVGGVVGGVLPGMNSPAPPPPPAPAPSAPVQDAAESAPKMRAASPSPNPMARARSLFLGGVAGPVATGFVQSQKAAAVAGSPNLGVRWRLLRQNAGGGFEFVPPNAALRAVEAVRVTLEPNHAGNLYVFASDGAGAWRLLFSNRAEPGRTYTVALEAARMAVLLSRDELQHPQNALTRALPASAGTVLIGPGTVDENAGYAAALYTSATEIAFEIPIRRE